MKRAVFLDLDGTLTDPKPGITGCIRYALAKLGRTPPAADDPEGDPLTFRLVEAPPSALDVEAPVAHAFSARGLHVAEFLISLGAVVGITSVEVRRFGQVDEEFAREEGEGDLSLDHWRIVHAAFFTRRADELGMNFGEESEVVLTRFEKLWPPS